MTTIDVEDFFARYQAALLARDEHRVARLYAVPGLILFPGQSLSVASEAQTATFFAASWAQYDGVNEVDHTIAVLLRGPHTVWADVTWSHDGIPAERMCYQLVAAEDGPRIAVLTALDLAD